MFKVGMYAESWQDLKININYLDHLSEGNFEACRYIQNYF